MKYNADIGPDPSEWLEADEAELIDAVLEHHRQAKKPVGASPVAHAGVHIAIETQLAEGHVGATAALSRLLAEGLERHEAIHAMGSVLAAEMYQMMKAPRPHDPELYSRQLNALTASSWRASSS